MIKEAIVKIVNKGDLSYDEAYAVMNEIMSGETTPTQNAAFLAALSTKSARAETTDEIAGCAAAMRDHATKVDTGMDIFEIVGTGGDNAHSFNISTTSALVAAAGGMKVAKHGNRAASSQCGTADCLEALGVNIQQSPEQCVTLLKEVGMCFFFAQKYHSSMKYVGAIRKELGFRTVFNILGPLTNPGSPKMQLLGVYDEYLVEPLARVLVSLGVKRGMVVYGQDKLDEISLSAPTSVCEIRDGWYKSYVITPEDFGFARCTKDDLKGGAPEENAAITRAILSGEKGRANGARFYDALKKDDLSFICEVKKASPSKGVIARDFPYLDIARDYEAAGADCISCLTEPKWFLGSDDIFREIRAAVSTPMLRKDFTVSDYQLYQSRLMGADCVLLICALLDTKTLAQYLAVCDELGLSALVETHDADEIRSAVAAGAKIIGVNNRNLKDFSVDFSNAARLRDRIPPEAVYVAESGVQSTQDVAALRSIGADAVLIGETLMRAPDKARRLAELRGNL